MRRRWSLLLAVAVLPLLGVPVQAGHGAPQVVRVSGQSPLQPSVADCAGSPQVESDPALALDPADPSRAAVAWVQDGGRAVLTAATADGGTTWSPPTVVPGLTRCTGGTLPLVLAPQLAWSEGLLHLFALARDPDAGAGVGVGRVLSSSSSDGGVSWLTQPSPDLAPVDVAVDLDSVAVEPATQDLLVVWSLADVDLTGERVFVSRSSDGGATWKRTSGPGAPYGASIRNRLLAPPGGRLVLLGVESPVLATRPDGGGSLRSLSAPTEEGLMWAGFTVGPSASRHWPAGAVSSTGTSHTAWLAGSGNESCSPFEEVNTCRLMTSSSADGVRWAPPREVAAWTGRWGPGPAVAAGPGHVTVLHTRPVPGGLVGSRARVEVASSVAGGPWQVHDLGEVRPGRVPGGLTTLGRWSAAASVPCGVLAVFVRTEQAAAGPVDVFAARVPVAEQGCA